MPGARHAGTTRPTIPAMASQPSLAVDLIARLPLAANCAAAGRKLMGSAGLRQPAAHS